MGLCAVGARSFAIGGSRALARPIARSSRGLSRGLTHAVAAPAPAGAAGAEQTFRCAVSFGSCTGIFWRGDPFTGKDPANKADWPLNGALLRGKTHKAKGV